MGEGEVGVTPTANLCKVLRTEDKQNRNIRLFLHIYPQYFSHFLKMDLKERLDRIRQIKKETNHLCVQLEKYDSNNEKAIH